MTVIATREGIRVERVSHYRVTVAGGADTIMIAETGLMSRRVTRRTVLKAVLVGVPATAMAVSGLGHDGHPVVTVSWLAPDAM